MTAYGHMHKNELAIYDGLFYNKSPGITAGNAAYDANFTSGLASPGTDVVAKFNGSAIRCLAD